MPGFHLCVDFASLCVSAVQSLSAYLTGAAQRDAELTQILVIGAHQIQWSLNLKSSPRFPLISMQYFGYLRRDPDAIGYDDWVNTLTADPSTFRHAIFGFLYSDVSLLT